MKIYFDPQKNRVFVFQVQKNDIFAEINRGIITFKTYFYVNITFSGSKRSFKQKTS